MELNLRGYQRVVLGYNYKLGQVRHTPWGTHTRLSWSGGVDSGRTAVIFHDLEPSRRPPALGQGTTKRGGRSVAWGDSEVRAPLIPIQFSRQERLDTRR